MALSFVVAAVVSVFFQRLRWLTAGGAIAATIVGAVTLHAGQGWVALLLFFFLSSNLLSRWRAAERTSRSGDVVAKGDRRDAAQVLANGGVFAIAAFASTLGDALTWQAVGAGAIAAAAADTWSTEVGTVLGGTPRHMVTGRRVPPGTSGGVTFAGSLAGLGGAVLAALLGHTINWDAPVVAVVAGGLCGSIVDSFLGGTIQERRWCDSCAKATERRLHACGTVTRFHGGLKLMTNDMVNLACTLTGAAVAGWLA
jgi:uncharacterized protein (TIGR00297 family)